MRHFVHWHWRNVDGRTLFHEEVHDVFRSAAEAMRWARDPQWEPPGLGWRLVKVWAHRPVESPDHDAPNLTRDIRSEGVRQRRSSQTFARELEKQRALRLLKKCAAKGRRK